jgi:capsule polysaccharide export protein KpsE/RkpR
MPKAIKQIVDAYVRLSDREALEDLMAHRQKLAVDLKSRTDFDFSLAIGQIDDDIAVIEAGVEKLRAAESSSG